MPALKSESPGVPVVSAVGALFAELLDEASGAKETATIEPVLTKAHLGNFDNRVSSALELIGGSIRSSNLVQDALAKEAAAKAAVEAARASGQKAELAGAEAVQSEAAARKASADTARIRQFAIIETAARDLFDKLIATTPIDSPDFVKMWNLLDIVSILSDDEQCDPGLLFWLVEELLDSQTIEGCRAIFDYLESRRDRITAKKFEQKKLVILRTCNELLRRLSRAEDTAFCGRVFIFMFQCFPLGDRSSVNLRGEYHVENVTSYESAPAAEGSEMDVDSQENAQEPTEAKNGVKGVSFDAKDAEKKGLDADTLYPLFWSLQGSFSQPLKLLQESNFAKFKTCLGATISTFESIPNEDEARSSKSAEDSRRNLKRKRDQDGHDTESYAPKYLTSRDLFELEMSDLAFRRHVLVQALIILDFLLSFSKAGKERMEAVPKASRSMLQHDELNEEDAKWTNEIKERIASYLRRGIDGPYFYRTVETVLARDKNWVIWKMAGCPPIKRDPVAPATFTEAKTAAQRMATHKRLRPVPMGAVSLDFLREENEEDAMARLQAKERYTLPELDSFKRKIADDDFEIEMPTNDQTKAAAIAGKSSKSWRALRIAARSKLAAFDKIDDPQNIGVVFEELQDLDDVLDDEEPAANPDDMPSNRETLIVAGPSGAGKSALVRKLLQDHPGVFATVVRHTTREPSEGEVDGKTFHFAKALEFNQLRDGDRLIEHGTRDGVDYGTSTKVVDAIVESGKVPVIELDIEAAQFAKDMGFSARYVHIKPPSAATLQQRLEKSDKDASAIQTILEAFTKDSDADNTSSVFDTSIVSEEDGLDDAAQQLGAYVFRKGEEEEAGSGGGGGGGDLEMQQGDDAEADGEAPVKENGDAGAETEMTDAPATQDEGEEATT